MKPHVCFVALKAYPVLSGERGARHIGGAEVQQTHIARALADRGYRISFVTLDVGQECDRDLNGIRAYSTYALNAGWPGLRFFHPRITSIWKAMRRADADIYYQRTSDTLTGVVCEFARRHRRKFVFAVGHDADCEAGLPACPTIRERAPYLFGLRRADCVVAQTLAQQQLLQHNFDVRSVVIRSCAVAPHVQDRDEIGGSTRLIWVGRFARDKRLELLLDVAESCPDARFQVLGDGPADDYVNGLRERARRLPNVEMVGYVPHAELPRYYQQTAALICSSKAEGFPNTFLEAWSRRIPVITSFDPDGVVTRFGLGWVGSSVDELAAGVRTMCSDLNERRRMGESAFEYFLTHHTVASAADAYDRLFRGIIGTPASRECAIAATTAHGESL